MQSLTLKSLIKNREDFAISLRKSKRKSILEPRRQRAYQKYVDEHHLSDLQKEMHICSMILTNMHFVLSPTPSSYDEMIENLTQV